MEMFLLYITFSIELMALTGGVALVVWGMRFKGDGSKIAKVSGSLIILGTLLLLLCTVLYRTALLHKDRSHGKMMHSEGMVQDKQMMLIEE